MVWREAGRAGGAHGIDAARSSVDGRSADARVTHGGDRGPRGIEVDRRWSGGTPADDRADPTGSRAARHAQLLSRAGARGASVGTGWTRVARRVSRRALIGDTDHGQFEHR